MFNSFGVVFFFVIPMTRYPVLQGSLWIGKISARYRWWSILYTVIAFIAAPLALFGISLIDETAGPIISLSKPNIKRIRCSSRLLRILMS